MSCRWLYSCRFGGRCLQDLFNIARSIDTVAAWKKLRFMISVNSDFHMTDRQSIALHAFASRVSMSFSVDETLLSRLVNLSTSFRELTFSVDMSPLWLKHMYSVLPALTWKPMPAAACSRQCKGFGLGGCICQKRYVIGVNPGCLLFSHSS